MGMRILGWAKRNHLKGWQQQVALGKVGTLGSWEAKKHEDEDFQMEFLKDWQDQK